MISERYQNDGHETYRLNDIQRQARDEVAAKIISKEYVFESVCCPVCNQDGMELLSEKDRYGLFYPVSICRRCGLVQSNPRMTQLAYERFYNCEYRKLYVGKLLPEASFFLGQERQGENIARFLTGKCNIDLHGKYVIEVGCGAGGILKHFRDVYGASVVGCDLGVQYLEYGIENFNLDLRHGRLQDLGLGVKADLIIYSHVFEHVLDLHEELKVVAEMLHPDGHLYIEVPGIDNIVNAYRSDFLRYLQNAHTYHFTRKSLRNVLSKCGFNTIQDDDYIRSLSNFAGEFHNQFHSAYGDTKTTLANLEKTYRRYRYSKENLFRVVKLNWRRIFERC